MDTFAEYWRGLTAAQKLDLAACGKTTKGHLQNVAYGFKPLSDGLCVAIEAYSKGVLRCEVLGPNAVWRRIPDPDWPWHPEGKPLIDPMPEQAHEPAAAGQGA